MSNSLQSGTFVENLLSPRRGSASPWLTWYSVIGERIELSGRVFEIGSRKAPTFWVKFSTSMRTPSWFLICQHIGSPWSWR